MLEELIARIDAREATVGVVGLGYVGLAVATAFATAGFRVKGVDLQAARVAKINAGDCPIEHEEPELPGALARVVASGKLTASVEHARLSSADVVLVCVETPVAGDNRPRFDALRSACREVGRTMKAGVLVIVESTLAPGTMKKVVAPALEAASGLKANESFFLGHCPERVMPRSLMHNLRELSRVVGGDTPETAHVMTALYRTIVRGDLDASDCATAELVKTAENAYRDVNIAFANELALVCESAGADFRRVRELVSKSPGRTMLWAGAGVGGPCIPKDPWLLVHGAADVGLRLIPTARAVNDAMPLHMARLVESALDEVGIGIVGSRVAVLGYAYLAGSDNDRNSPSAALVEHLEEWGAEVTIHDPHVRGHQGDLWTRVHGCDAAIVMVAHEEYSALDLPRLRREMRNAVLVDGRHTIESGDAAAAGFVFRGLGRSRISAK